MRLLANSNWTGNYFVKVLVVFRVSTYMHLEMTLL